MPVHHVRSVMFQFEDETRYRIIEDGKPVLPVREEPTPFGLLKDPKPSRSGDRRYKKRDAPCKACPHCGTVHLNGIRICHECSYEFFEKVTR